MLSPDREDRPRRARAVAREEISLDDVSLAGKVREIGHTERERRDTEELSEAIEFRAALDALERSPVIKELMRKLKEGDLVVVISSEVLVDVIGLSHQGFGIYYLKDDPEVAFRKLDRVTGFKWGNLLRKTPNEADDLMHLLTESGLTSERVESSLKCLVAEITNGTPLEVGLRGKGFTIAMRFPFYSSI